MLNMLTPFSFFIFSIKVKFASCVKAAFSLLTTRGRILWLYRSLYSRPVFLYIDLSASTCHVNECSVYLLLLSVSLCPSDRQTERQSAFDTIFFQNFLQTEWKIFYYATETQIKDTHVCVCVSVFVTFQGSVSQQTDITDQTADVYVFVAILTGTYYSVCVCLCVWVFTENLEITSKPTAANQIAWHLYS